MNKKILMFAILGMFLISFASVSAIEKDYDSSTKTLTLTDEFLWINTGEIATVQLLTPLNYRVGLGYQKVAEMKITGFKDYQDFISQMNFYDVKNNMGQINREYDLMKKEIIEVEFPDYDCSDEIINGTIEKVCIENGSHLENRWIWTKLLNPDIKKNDELIIAIFTDVQEEDIIEWIPTIATKEVKEWATWTADLNTNILSYYKFDGTSGAIIDELSNVNGTNSGTTRGVTGIVNYAFDFAVVPDTKTATFNEFAKIFMSLGDYGGITGVLV